MFNSSSKINMLVIGFALVALLSNVALAQDTTGRGNGGNGSQNMLQYFDPDAIVTISGNLTEFLGLWSANGNGDCTGAGLHFTIASGGETYYAMFGPFFYLEDNGLELADGMRVTLTGSIVPPHNEDFADHDYIIVTEVTAGGTTVQLRDENGLPLWSGANKDDRGNGQYYNCPVYSTKSTTSVTGTVLSVVTRTGGANADAGVQLKIRTEDGQRLRVYVAPQYYCEANNFSVAKGDTVKVRGSLQNRNLVSSSVTCNGDYLQTRDRKGNPSWVSGQ